MAIITRSAKGSELSFNELDTNITDLRDRPDGVVRPKDKGWGTKVDLASPTYPWRDLEGNVTPRASAPNAATLEVFRDNVREWAFAAGDVSDNSFHIPHDYVPGSDLYFHVHWSHTGTSISGSLVFTLNYMYAKGHNQAAFPAQTVLTFPTISPTIGTHPQYQHIITEVQLSAAAPAAGQIDSDIIEVDGLILANFVVTTIPTIGSPAGASVARPYIHHIDLHYQSTEIGTKGKAPDFWT
jgi:hypothetical protein